MSTDGLQATHLAAIETDQPLAEILDACVDLAERIERGESTSLDEATLVCHLRVLRTDLDLTVQTV